MPSTVVAAALPCAKRLRREETETSGEVLSSMPDAIIGHIFSFLSIEDGLRTSVLSKRWSRLWWTNTTSISYTYGGCYNTSLEFQGLCDTIDRVFSQCPLLRLHIEGLHYCSSRERLFDSWLLSAVSCRLPDVSLSVPPSFFNLAPEPTYQLPVFFFTNLSLVTLQLYGCFFTRCPGRVNWYLLKDLCIGNVEMTDAILGMVLDGSPSLESLNLVCCWGMNHIRLDSRKLRALAIDGYKVPYRVQSDGCLILDISAPNLLSLQITGELYRKRGIRLHRVFSLVEAKLNFELKDFGDEGLTSLLRSLSTVNSLMLGTAITMSLREEIGFGWPPRVPLVLRCPTLILGDCVQAPSLVTLRCLLCCFEVPSLVIYFDSPDYDDVFYQLVYGEGQNTRWKRLNSQEPWASHLKTIKINGFWATTLEKAKRGLIVIGFLLREAVAMETMTIGVRGVCNKEELESLVLGLPRANKASRIIFHYP